MPRKKLAKTDDTTPEPTATSPAPKPKTSRPKKAQAPAPEVVQVAETVSEPTPVEPARKSRKKTPAVAPSMTPEASPAPAEPATEPSPVEEPAAVPATPRPKRAPTRKATASAAPAATEVAPKAAKPAARGRGKAAPVVAPEPVVTEPTVAEAVVSEPVAEPEVAEVKAPVPTETKGRSRTRRGGSRGRTEEPVAAPAATEAAATEPDPVTEAAPVDENYDFATFDLPIPEWRPRTSAKGRPAPTPSASSDAEAEEADEAASGEGSDSDNGNRRRGRRRRRGRDRNGRETQEVAGAASAEADADSSADLDEAMDEPVDEPAGEPTDRLTNQPGAQILSDPDQLIELSVTMRPRQRGQRNERREPAPQAAPTPVATTAPAPTSVPQPEPAPTFRRERVTPKAPEKAAIAIPEEAPQIVVRQGVPTLVRNHRVYPPIMFFGSPSDEKRLETVLEQVRMAAEAGVHLHSYLIDFEVDPNTVDDAAAFAAFILARSVQVDPESQVIFRMVFQAPRNWEQKYPNGRYRLTDGSTAEPSVCDDEFWNVARNCLERFVRQMRLLDLRDHIMGVHLERGEWFFPEGLGYDDSKAAQLKFRDWARLRYLNDEVTLRASWFDGFARFDNIEVPPFQPEGEEGDRFIRSSRRQRRYVDYHLFLSDATVQRIADLAYSAKAASEGSFLIGASYGYTFEWSHPGSGHLSLGKLLRTPEIDFIAGPPSYRSRQPGGSAPFPGPIDSFALNGKLYISEEDFKTSLSIGHEPDDFNPQLKTPQALESVHWRGVGASLAHASGVAWMDLWGNGWLRTNSVWERAKKVREAMIDRLAAPLDAPDVAIFIDERALAYLVDDHAFKLLVQNVRESVLRAGVSAAFYLLSDLAHRETFPESKLYLFLNAWDIRPELRAAIKSRLQRDNKVLFWLYSAGLFDAGRDSLERAREVTGIALKPQPFYSRAGTTILNRRHPLSEAFPDRNLVGGTKLEPSYFAIPEGATVLGEYTQTGLPSFVVKEFNEGPAETHWTSVFLGEPQVNPALIRALAQMAGAHVWNFHEDVVHVRHPFCTVHCQGAGPRTLTLPGKYSAYNLLNNEWSAVDSSHLRFTAVEGATYCFLVGSRDELEQQLNTDPGKLLYIDRLPPREANVRVDSSNFDVPIMKLDEWRAGDDSDDNADEWFLRPQSIEEEPAVAQADDSPERIGRRRRRRRGGRGNGSENGSEDRGPRESGFEPAPTGGADFEEVGLSVMFRKRE